MINLDRIATFEDFRQVAGQSDTCHLRSVALGVISPPPRFDGMEVTGGEGRGEQSVPSIDTRIEQTHVRRLLRLSSESCSRKEIVKPRTLFITMLGIEELRRLFRPSQLGNAVERDHRALHVFRGCTDQ